MSHRTFRSPATSKLFLGLCARMLVVLSILATTAGAAPRHLYLTWTQSDTAHTQTIVFQTLGQAKNPRVELVLPGQPKAKNFQVKSLMLQATGRRVHHLTITGLEPKTTYKFRAGDDNEGLSPWHTFRTLPDDNTPIKILTGGDMYRHPETVQLLNVGKKLDPDVALVGGDIAYADGNINNYAFWDDWFDNWARHLNGKERIVPMILAIGNHEVAGAFGRPKTGAPFYFAYFPQGGEPYFSRKLGSDIDLVVLDTGHVTSYQSQVPFLEQALKNSKTRFQLALYHVPCYPTHRPFDDPYSAQGRQHWVPLFDKYDLDLALENHDHVFKRTYPLKANKIDRAGTVYLGDGCWGRTPRTVAGRRWYHEKALPKEHVWFLQIQPDGLQCEAYDTKGNLFDRTLIRE